MARVKREISRVELEAVINQVESSGEYSAPSKVYEAVSETDWGKLNKVSASVVYLRVREFGIQLKTQPGKKGRSVGFPPGVQRGPRTPRSEKLKVHAATFTALRRIPSIPLKLVDRAEAGSVMAALKLKCLDCSNYDRSEIKHCQVIDCSLYPIRPYQTSVDVDEDVVEDAAA